MRAAAGIVMTQAITIRCATFQRTAEARRAAPTPTIAPVIVWVVDTGMPRPVARNKVMDPAVSAQTPCTGVSRVILEPIVRTMRQPPSKVPSAIAPLQLINTRSRLWSQLDPLQSDPSQPHD